MSMQIAIVEDHLLLAQTLQHSLEVSLKDCTVKLFESAEKFMANDFRQWLPDIVLADIMLDAMDGVEMMEKTILTQGAHPKFILLSSITDIYTVKNAMRKGAKGYLTKNASLNEMIEAIETVLRGGQYISQALKENLLAHMFTTDDVILHLSPKEKEVLQRICSGNTRKEIAYDMKLSIHTVQQYSKSLMNKFKVNGIAELVVFAIQKGFYHPEKKG